jgi:hypothetical protein
MPGEAGVTVVTMLVCFLFCMRGRERVERPAFPAPSEFQTALCLAKLARIARRDRGAVGELRAASCAHDNGIAGLHPSSREAVGSRRAKLALRVARSAGWGLSFRGGSTPPDWPSASHPPHRFAEGGIRKIELRSELCSSDPHAEEAHWAVSKHEARSASKLN